MKPEKIKRNIKFGALAAAWLGFASLASAQLTVTTTNQNGALPFTPTWSPAPDSLIAGLSPTTANGTFTLDLTTRNVNSLTAGGSLAISAVSGDTGPDPVGNSTTSANYVTCGNGSSAGSLITYTLPASTYGYNLTNITVYSGWKDNGRDAQAYTVLYSTVSNPGNFIWLTNVNYNPTVPGSTPTANRVSISDALGGVIASNVAVIAFDFTDPQVENGYTGYGAITVEGKPATSTTLPAVTISASNQTGADPFTPSWTLETPNLIAGMAPSTGAGNFTQESSGGTPVLTDGAIGISGNVATMATVGAGGGTTLIYTLTNSSYGSDITNIVVYSGWGNGDRDGQYYTVSYSPVSSPTAYIPITTVYYNPQQLASGLASANRVAISNPNGLPLAKGVGNIQFSFSTPPAASQFDNGYQGFSEIVVQGQNSATPPPPPSPYLIQDTLPTHAETFSGDQVVFTAAYSNSPPANVQWLVVKNGVTNTISGATGSKLTLNNVQITDSGSYMLEAVNATNGSASPSFSAAAPLVVAAPVTTGNVIQENSGQTGPSTFYPAWSINTNIDLIFGFPTDGSGNPGTAAAGPGSYNNQTGLSSDPTILADGVLGDSLSNMVSCGWVNVGAGTSMTYTMPATANGYNITNITIYGGWPDDGRNEQKYQILYSTPSAPTTFSGTIGTFDYNPSFTSGEPNANRVILVPVSGVLAQNVYAIEINFNLQTKNDWNGYSEITINGTPSLGVIPSVTQDITPLTAEDVVGSSLILTGGFNGATSYQWQKNGVNIPGATTTTLTLNNLQLTDTATNGGYQLLGINAAGTNSTRACAVIVDPVPAATNNVITAFAYQTSDSSSFGPTWDISTLSSSLIAYQDPPGGGYDQTGNFNDPDTSGFLNTAGGLPVLTDCNYGVFASNGSHPAFATAGPSAGNYVIYTLGSNPNGYTVTNIQIAGGWNDNGRNSQFYTVSYSTVANPTLFYTINAVSASPTFPTESVIRTTMTSTTGVLASNVYAIQVDFQYPQNVPNGYSGYSEISVFGAPTATAPPAGPVITAQNETNTFDWVVETPNLIAHQLPSSVGPGVFTEEGCNETNLTDGVIGFGSAFGASCGDDGVAVPWIIFTPANGGSWNLTNIVVYSLWHDYGRDGQFYNLSYSTLSAPTTFIPLASVSYNPFVPHNGVASGNRVAISPAPGQTMLASNVAAVKFDFTPQGTEDYGWSGYSEIVLQGSGMAPWLFGSANVSGGNLVLKSSGGTPNGGYTLLTTTNLNPPVIWTTNTTGLLDANGASSNAIPINAGQGNRFFKLRSP